MFPDSVFVSGDLCCVHRCFLLMTSRRLLYLSRIPVTFPVPVHHRWTSFGLHSQAFMLRLRQCTSKPSAAIAMWPNKACLSSVENARDWIPMNSFKFNKRNDSKMGNTGIVRKSPSIFGYFWALPIPSS